jgi:spermidine/putrescine transport system permease protein
MGRDRTRDAAFLLPGLAWLVAFFAVPLAIILVVSLGSRDQFGGVLLDTLGLGNYVRALEPDFLPTVANSLRYATLTTIFSIAIAYPIAYWISRYGGRRKVLFLVLVMLPFWTSWVIRTYAWMTILRDNGVVNGILTGVGIIDTPIALLNTDLAVVLGMTYGFLPFAILPLYVSIDRLDPSLVAAARDLYADGRAAFWHVTLPLTMPGVC